MRTIATMTAIGFGTIAVSAQALAADRNDPPATPQAVQRLLQCRSLTDSQQRLACFDRETAVVANDISRKDLVVVDRGQITRTRRTLFGLELPRLDILGDSAADEIKQIESTVQSYGNNREGGALFVLADGSRWSQTDSTTYDVPPRRGDKVRVRRAALGSYSIVVEGQPPMKVKRVQ